MLADGFGFAAGGATSCEVTGGSEASGGGAAEAAEVSEGAADVGAGAAGGGATAAGASVGGATAGALVLPELPVNVIATASVTLNVCTSPLISNRSTACVPPK